MTAILSGSHQFGTSSVSMPAPPSQASFLVSFPNSGKRETKRNFDGNEQETRVRFPSLEVETKRKRAEPGIERRSPVEDALFPLSFVTRDTYSPLLSSRAVTFFGAGLGRIHRQRNNFALIETA